MAKTIFLSLTLLSGLSMVNKITIPTIGNLVRKEIECLKGGDIRPKLETTIITDTTWTSYETLKFFMQFGELTDVSLFGSSLSVIKGDNGKLIAYSENSLGNIYVKWRSVKTLGVPALPRSLITARDLVLRREENESLPAAHVTLVLATSNVLTNAELQDSVTLINSIKNIDPDMHFTYVTSEALAPMFRMLISMPRTKDDIIVTTELHAGKHILEDISIMNEYPRVIKPRKCNNSTKEDLVEISSHANPSTIAFYRIHPCYLTQTTLLEIEVTNSDKGNLVVCISRNEREENKECQEASIKEKINFPIRNPCPSKMAYGRNAREWNEDCAPVFFTIIGKRSYSSCTDQFCRMPDDIPFALSIRGLKCIKEYPLCTSQSNYLKNSIMLSVFMFILSKNKCTSF